MCSSVIEVLVIAMEKFKNHSKLQYIEKYNQGSTTQRQLLQHFKVYFFNVSAGILVSLRFNFYFAVDLLLTIHIN